MNNKLEELIETFRCLKQTDDMTPSERSFVTKKKRDLWWEIKQESKHFSAAVRQRIYRSSHPEQVFNQIIRQKEKQKQLKLEVMTHYGNGTCACVKCGESRLACLSIDHIEGRGNRHRKGLLRGSGSFYAWLKKKGFPPGYQTLCMNDQFLKRFENNEEGRYAFEPIDWQPK